MNSSENPLGKRTKERLDIKQGFFGDSLRICHQGYCEDFSGILQVFLGNSLIILRELIGNSLGKGPRNG